MSMNQIFKNTINTTLDLDIRKNEIEEKLKTFNKWPKGEERVNKNKLTTELKEIKNKIKKYDEEMKQIVKQYKQNKKYQNTLSPESN